MKNVSRWRDGGKGEVWLNDLYASVRVRGEWRPRKNLGPQINTELDEYHPSLSSNGKTLFFVRHSYEPWIPGDIYRFPVSALQGLWPEGGRGR